MDQKELELLKKGFVELHKERADRIQTLGVILRLAETATNRQSKEEVGQKILDILAQETGFENISILSYDDKEDCLRLDLAKGAIDVFDMPVDKDYNKELVFKRGEGIAWQVFDSQTPFFLEDCKKESLSEKFGAKIKPGSLACLPLMGQGVINLSCSEPKEFHPHQKRDLIILSRVVSHLLQATELKDKLYASHQNLQQLVEAKTRELRHANFELKASMAFMESVIENVPQGICLLDGKGLIRHVNPAFLKIFHCTDAVCVCQSPFSLFKEISAFERLEKGLKENRVVQLSDVALKRTDGSTFPADIFLHPLKGDQEESYGAMLVIHDLTGQRAKTEQILQTEKLKALGSMAGGIAHDFNNILATISGNVELLKKEIKDPRILKRLKVIERAVSDGAHTVRRLQAFRTGGSGDKRPLDHVTNVKRVILDSIQLTKPQWKDTIQKQGVTIEIKTDLKQTPPVAIHPSELREVLVNIIFNAVEAMVEGGTITIKFFARNGEIVISISDNGPGMSEEVKKQIFDPFFTTKGVDNTGLGLSVCHSLIRRAGGIINVNSKEGVGTSFEIILPEAIPMKSRKKRLDVTSPKVDKLKILLVDDEREIVTLLSTMLESLGHTVIKAYDGQMASDELERNDVDLVLTDLGMPGISGWEVASMVKKKNSKLPVILFTGWGAEYEDKDLKAMGVDYVLGKPFKLGQLTKAISHVFNRDKPS